MEVDTGQSPNIRGGKKTRSTKKPSNPPNMKMKYLEKFIKNGLLESQIRDGNLKDVFEELIAFKEKNNFKDQTFNDVLQYSQGPQRKVVDAIDKLLISSNEAEFMNNINKLGGSVGLGIPVQKVQEGQGYRDIKPSDMVGVKGDKSKVETIVEEMESKMSQAKPTLTSLKYGASNYKDYTKIVFRMKKEAREQGKDPLEILQMSEGLFKTGEPDTTEDNEILRKIESKMSQAKPTPKPTPTPKAKAKADEPSQTTGKVQAFTDKEIKDTMDEMGVSEKEAIQQLKLASEMGDPTISPDVRDTRIEMKEEKQAQREAKDIRSKPKEMTEEEVGDILDIPEPPEPKPENVKMKIKKANMKTEIDDLKPLPSKSDFIPPMRLGTRGKDLKDLLEDIMYFMKNFKSQLKKESEFLKNVDTSNINQVRELHNRIVAKLAPKEKREEGKRIGVVVNADEYIREQMKKILQEQTFSSLRPDDVVIDVGSKRAEGRDSDNKDFGDFAVKRTIDGGLASTREAVYRYMPSENDPDVGEEGQTNRQRKKPNRLSMPKPRLNNERTNAIRMNVRNPFRVPQKTIKLKYLY